MKLSFMIFLCLCSTALAQDSLGSQSKDRYFRLVYDNDLFNSTDRYYTQGVMVELTMPVLRYSPLSKILLRLRNSERYHSVSFEQDCFTPKSISVDTLNYEERPYTGTLVMSQQIISMNALRRNRLTAKMDLGVLGPCAKCEETQKKIHKITNNEQPLGWEFQLNGDYIFNYSLLYEKGWLNKKHFDLIGFAESRAGTLYDDMAAGLFIRAGWMNSYFQNIGISKTASRKMQLYFTVRGKARLVGYNATLEGGTFTKSLYTIESKNIERLVYYAYFSAVIAYKRLCLEYQQTYLTPEFKTGLDHGWGRINILFCF
jgi:hypothetical protein